VIIEKKKNGVSAGKKLELKKWRIKKNSFEKGSQILCKGLKKYFS